MGSAAVISGVFNTKVGKVEGATALGLHAEAAIGAVEDAGLRLSDLDGVLCAYILSEGYPMLSSAFCEYVGLEPGFSSAVQVGGASAVMMVTLARALVAAGICRHVLCVTGDNRLSSMSRDGAVAALAEFGHPQFEVPYGITIPAAYALVAQRYLHETGTTLEHLAAIAVTHRAHAALHPDAHMRQPLSLEEVQRSRVISSPLRLYDCCLISDGGAAVVVSDAERGSDLRRHPVQILGTGQGHTHEHISAAPSLLDFGCKRAAECALAEAGVSCEDIDVAEIYDSFTITLLVELESMGFFARGEAGEAALKGELSYGGRLPCNTHGGLLSFGHSGASGGMFHVVEAVLQLRREADDRQLPDVELAFVHGDGGVLSAHASLVLAR